MIVEIAALIYGGIGHARIRDEVVGAIAPGIGPQASAAVRDLIENTFEQAQRQGLVAGIVSWCVLIFAATGFVGAIQAALDAVWNAQRPKRPWWGALLDRGLAALAIGAVALLVLVSIAFDAVVPNLLPLRYAISTVLAALIFMVVFRFLPHARPAWRDVAFGAVVTAVLFVAGQSALSWYLARPSTTSTFGAAGSFVALLLWLYYSGQIFLFGAELTKAYARRLGSHANDLARSAA